MRHSNTIGYLLQHTASLMAKQNEQVLQEQLGIGMSQFKILRALQSKTNPTQREIAANLGQTEASISRQVKLMLDNGLLSSTVSPRNRREHIVTATVKGIKLTEAALEILYQRHQPAFDTLGKDGQQQLLDNLQKLHEQLCDSLHEHLIHPKKF